MQLLQAKNIGHTTLKSSGWFSLSPELTLLYGPHESGKTAILKSLESINPFYDVEQAKSFASYPQFTQVGKRTRKVIPAKKTAVFGIFVCDKPLREQLAALDPVFYETDRIEVGRRLDYSRWTNFVEIAASTRWSEIAEPMQKLYQRSCKESGGSRDDGLIRLLENLKPTDRLKDESATLLVKWLSDLKAKLGQTERKTIEQCIFAVRRAERFGRARHMVAEYLPLFFYLTPDHTIEAVYDLASFSGAVSSLHPLMFLLQELALRHQGQKNAQNAGGLDGERSEHLLTILNAPPEENKSCEQLRTQFYFNDDRVEIIFSRNNGDKVPIEGLSLLDRRWALLRAVIALHQALFEKPPMLLLDQFETGLSAQEQEGMLQVLQKMSASCQIVLASSDKRLARKIPEKNVRTILTGQDGHTIASPEVVEERGNNMIGSPHHLDALGRTRTFR